MTPQPRLDENGVPWCSFTCIHYDDSGDAAECDVGGIAGDSCIPCIPAVRQMDEQLRRVRELCESKLPQEPCGKHGCVNVAHRRGLVGGLCVWFCEEHAGEIEMGWPDASPEITMARDVLRILDGESEWPT